MDERLLRDGVDRAMAGGAADAELILSRHVEFDVQVSGGAVENFSLSEGIGLGVRVLTRDGRIGFAYATDLTNGAAPVVDAAWQNALGGDPDPFNALPDAGGESQDDWVEQDFYAIPSADKVAFTRLLEEKTLAADPRISRVDRASYADSLYEVTLANSRGLQRYYRSGYCSCSVVAAANEAGSDGESGWEFDFARRFDDLRPEWVAQGCAEDATRLLGGKPCATGSMPVVLDNYVAMQFLQVIGPSLMANNVLKGKSLMAQLRGEAIASEHVTVIDRNDLPKGLNRAPFDGEGTPAQETILIHRGVLKAFLHTTYTARKMGETSTANAARAGFRSTPDVGATNCYLDSGAASQDDLFAAAGQGLFVTGAMGVHTADPISGDFSFGASGLLIENGRLGRPVRGVTIAGNIKDVLKGIVAVGNDLRFFGAYGSPSVLVSQMMVSGE